MSSFKMHEIRELIRLIDESDIEQFELEMDGSKVTIKKANGVPAVGIPRETEAVVSAPRYVEAPAAPVIPVNQELPQETAAPEKSALEQAAHLHKIVSPMVGTFYQAPSPDSGPYVQEGDQVSTDSVVCIVEAMKLMNEIEAEVQGKIVKILVENGQLVEYGQPLFLVEKR